MTEPEPMTLTEYEEMKKRNRIVEVDETSMKIIVKCAVFCVPDDIQEDEQKALNLLHQW